MIYGGQGIRSECQRAKFLISHRLPNKPGATLVINHQPHVVGGFQWRDQTLTAWTMGSFLADQTVWSALKSYLLAVYVREGKVFERMLNR